MSAKRVFLLCGIPGSGKSYWAKNKFMPYILNTAYISRDEVRFSMLGETDEYFSKEREVFDEFVKRINDAIDNSSATSILVDATHLNEASRMKILNRLHIKNCSVIAVDFTTSMQTCLARNDKREGRAKVPRGVVRRMFFQHTSPRDDKFKYDEVMEVGDSGIPYK